MTDEPFYIKFEKKEIAELPRYVFSGKIVVIQSVPEAERAITFLLKQKCLGLDTETRPNFKKGISHKVALLQVATADICFLFRLNMIGLPDCLIRLLEAKDIQLVGLSLHDDLNALRKRYHKLSPTSWIDLQKIVSKIGIDDLSLQKLFAGLFRMHISKGARLSNWENDILTETQKIYAATDAEACLRIYKKIKNYQNNL